MSLEDDVKNVKKFLKTWVDEETLSKATEDDLKQFCVGAAREIFCDFFIPAVKSDQYIKTMRANLCLHSRLYGEAEDIALEDKKREEQIRKTESLLQKNRELEDEVLTQKEALLVPLKAQIEEQTSVQHPMHQLKYRIFMKDCQEQREQLLNNMNDRADEVEGYNTKFYSNSDEPLSEEATLILEGTLAKMKTLFEANLSEQISDQIRQKQESDIQAMVQKISETVSPTQLMKWFEGRQKDMMKQLKVQLDLASKTKCNDAESSVREVFQLINNWRLQFVELTKENLELKEEINVLMREKHAMIQGIINECGDDIDEEYFRMLIHLDELRLKIAKCDSLFAVNSGRQSISNRDSSFERLGSSNDDAQQVAAIEENRMITAALLKSRQEDRNEMLDTLSEFIRLTQEDIPIAKQKLLEQAELMENFYDEPDRHTPRFYVGAPEASASTKAQIPNLKQSLRTCGRGGETVNPMEKKVEKMHMLSEKIRQQHEKLGNTVYKHSEEIRMISEESIKLLRRVHSKLY